MHRIPSIAKHVAFPVVACLFVLIRVWNAYPVVFDESGDVRLSGVDSYFHLRHAQFSADHFPHLLRYDPGSHYPGHARQSFSGLFNISIAALAIVGSGFHPTEASVSRAAAWIPIMLSVLALWALFRLATFFGGAAAGFTAVALMALYPASTLSRSLLGFSDQHVAEYLLVFLSVAGLVYCLNRSVTQPARSWWKPALLHGAPFAALFYTWIGAPMYIAVLAFAVFTLLIQSVLRPEDRKTLGIGLFRFFSAVAIWQVFVLVFWSELIMELEPNMRWWNLAGISFLAVAPRAYLMVTERLERRGASSRVIAFGSVLLVALVVYFFFTQVPKGRVFFGWLAGVRGFEVGEQRSLGWREIWNLLGPVLAFAALSISLPFLKHSSSEQRRWLIVPIAVGCAVTFLWLRTHDFDYIAPIFLAFMASISIREVFARALAKAGAARGGARASWKFALTCAVAVVMLLPIWPLRVVQTPWMPAARIEQATLFGAAWFDAMKWMRTETPKPSVLPASRVEADLVNPYPDGSYGVMTAWDYGNFVASNGERPAVTSQYPTAQSAQWMMARSESEAAAFLCPTCRPPETVRYVVLNTALISDLFVSKAQLAGNTPSLQQEGYWNYEQQQVPHVTFGAPYEDALVTQLFRRDGTGLSHYRLAYESAEEELVHYTFDPVARSVFLRSIPNDSDETRLALSEIAEKPLTSLGGSFIYDAQILPEIKIFEIVEGAVISGTIQPGHEVDLRLNIEALANGRTFEYRQLVHADALGQFSFTVPYATILSDSESVSTVRASGPYVLSFGDASAHVEMLIDVTEEDVRSGANVPAVR